MKMCEHDFALITMKWTANAKAKEKRSANYQWTENEISHELCSALIATMQISE